MSRHAPCWLLLAALGLGCEAPDLGVVRGPVGPNLGTAGPWTDAGLKPPADRRPPTILELEVEAGEAVGVLRARVGDDRGVVGASVWAGASGPLPVRLRDDRLEAMVPLLPSGPTVVRVVVRDGADRTAEAEVVVERPPAVTARAPALTLTAPIDGSASGRPEVLIEGEAADPVGVVRVEIEGARQGPLGLAATADHFRRFAATVPLPAGGEETYTVRAINAAGLVTERARTVRSRRPPAHGPPTLIPTPADGARVDSLRMSLLITTEGAAPVVEVWSRVDRGPWSRGRNGESGWSIPLRLRPGANHVRVLGRDADGLVGEVELSLMADDGWPDGPVVRLRPPDGDGGVVRMDLDRAGVAEIFPPDLQVETELLVLDPAVLVAGAIDAIREACDGECPASWGPVERNLRRLMILTPSTTDVTGSRLETAASLSDELLGLPFEALLADALGLDPYARLLPDAPLAAALVATVLADHPAATADGGLPVTLRDALTDMRTLAERFGPMGAHPGFLAGEPAARVLGDDFRMRLVVYSNIGVRRGLSLADRRKRWFAVAPEGAPVADLEFLDPDRFSIEGLIDEPRVDFDFVLFGAEAPVPLVGRADPEPRGGGAAWSLPGWTLERVVAEAAYRAFSDLRAGCDLCGGAEAGALLYQNRNGTVDLAEITIGRAGYDCPAGARCGRRPTPPGEPEHFTRFDAEDCEGVADCPPGALCHRAGRDDDRGRCVEPAAVLCADDRDCGRDACLHGRCVRPGEIECGRDGQCQPGEVCHDGGCRAVPAGWFRVWMPDDLGDLPPAYIWDVMLDVAQARLRDGVPEGAPISARFGLQGVPTGLRAAEMSAAVRASLQRQREALSEALLGAVLQADGPVDLYADRDAEGRGWLVLHPCGVPGARCAAPPGDGIFAEDGGRLDRPGPDGHPGVPIDLLDDRVLEVRRAGASHRIEAVVVGEEVRLWLRGSR